MQKKMTGVEIENWKSRRRSTAIFLTMFSRSTLSLSVYFFFSLLHWCKDHSILSPTASHYDLLNWFVSLYVIHRDMRPCGLGQVGLVKVVWPVNIQPGSVRETHAIPGFLYLWFTRKLARKFVIAKTHIETRETLCRRNEEIYRNTHFTLLRKNTVTWSFTMPCGIAHLQNAAINRVFPFLTM